MSFNELIQPTNNTQLPPPLSPSNSHSNFYYTNNEYDNNITTNNFSNNSFSSQATYSIPSDENLIQLSPPSTPSRFTSQYNNNINNIYNNNNVNNNNNNNNNTGKKYLFLLPSANIDPSIGISARSVKESYEMIRKRGNNIVIATAKGMPIAPFTPSPINTNSINGSSFIDQSDENSLIWTTENAHLFSDPFSLEAYFTSSSDQNEINNINGNMNINGNNIGEEFEGIVVPSSLASFFDLAFDPFVLRALSQFHFLNKGICGIGYGVAALCNLSNLPNKSLNKSGANSPFFSSSSLTPLPLSHWLFSSFSLTSITNVEGAGQRYFNRMPFSAEDFIREQGGYYSRSSAGHVHVVVDRNLITAQNEISTSLAIRNLLFLSDPSY